MRPRFLADENIDPDVVLGLRRRFEQTDIVRVQDVGLRTLDDPEILRWAADENRILITHDFRTVPRFAGERLSAGLSMPGVIAIRRSVSIAQAIDELAAVTGASQAEEWRDKSPTCHSGDQDLSTRDLKQPDLCCRCPESGMRPRHCAQQGAQQVHSLRVAGDRRVLV